MRRRGLTAAMLLFGAVQILGGAISLIPTALLPIDQYVGSQASVAAIALGVGICAAAFEPLENLSWVRIALVYTILVTAYQVGGHFLVGLPIAPVPLGVALGGAVLLILFYPVRRELLPPARAVNAASTRWLDPDYQP